VDAFVDDTKIAIFFKEPMTVHVGAALSSRHVEMNKCAFRIFLFIEEPFES